MIELDDNVIRMVEAVVRETVEQLSGTQKNAKSCLVLAPCYLIDLPEAKTYLEGMLKDCKATIIHSGPADLSMFPVDAKLISADDSAQRNAVAPTLHTFDSIVCLQPSLSMLGKTIAGDDSDFYSFVLTQAALRGIEASVMVWFDRPLKKGAFFDKVRNLLDGIADMGICVEYCGRSQNKTTTYGDPHCSLITEDDVLKEFSHGSRSIKAGKRTIITPLAKDKANELGMAIEKGKE